MQETNVKIHKKIFLLLPSLLTRFMSAVDLPHVHSKDSSEEN
jgi:hypothetical protein